MDWRTRLRKLVNHDGHLGPMRLALMRTMDPVEWYMRRNDPEDRRPSRRRRARGAVGWTEYGPLAKPSGSTESLFAAARSVRSPEGAERRIENYRKGLDTFRREHATLLESKARELLTGKQTAIETTAGTVRAKLVRFRNGAILEQWRTSPQESGHGMMRVELRDLSDLLPLIVNFLAQTVVGLGPHARPLR